MSSFVTSVDNDRGKNLLKGLITGPPQTCSVLRNTSQKRLYRPTTLRTGTYSEQLNPHDLRYGDSESVSKEFRTRPWRNDVL